MVLDAIFDFIKERVIIAGITWIIGLLNPISAFFKAFKAIYDIVMFFINRGSQILEFVNAVVDSIAAIAKGDLGKAASMVEGALAKAVPVAIGFLAGLLGLGDPATPVRETIEKARSPVEKAIDWVINLAVKGVKAAGGFLKGLFGGKKKEEKPEAKPKEDDPQKEAKVEAVLLAIDSLEQQYLKDGLIKHEDAEKVAAKVKNEHPVFTSIQVVEGEETWDYDYVASPSRTKTGERRSPADKVLEIDKIIDRPKFRPTTVVAIPITAEQNRRHIDAWQAMHENLKLTLNGKTAGEAYDILRDRGYTPDRRSEPAVLEAAGRLLRDQFNDEENLFAGPAKPNQEYGRKFAVAKKAAEKAYEAGNQEEFEANLIILEKLWRDPDAPKEGLGLVGVTIEMLRQWYRQRWG
jgi:hypothetical protein